MRTYELMVVFDPDLEDGSVKTVLDGFLEVITKGGGSLDDVDVWGRRRLAYEINKKTEGIYAVVNYTADSAVSQELDRQLGLDERVMRVKIIRPEEQVVSGK